MWAGIIWVYSLLQKSYLINFNWHCLIVQHSILGIWHTLMQGACGNHLYLGDVRPWAGLVWWGVQSSNKKQCPGKDIFPPLTLWKVAGYSWEEAINLTFFFQKDAEKQKLSRVMKKKWEMPLWNTCRVLSSLTLGYFKLCFIDGKCKALRS